VQEPPASQPLLKLLEQNSKPLAFQHIACKLVRASHIQLELELR
jgi:hypothetical protein